MTYIPFSLIADWSLNLTRGGSLLTSLAVAFVGGLLTCLTPCVYPVIPLSIGQMSRWRSSGRRRTIALSGLFSLSMAAVYTGLGLLAGFTNVLFGSWFASPLVKLGAGLLMWVFAAGLLGVYRFQVPSRILQWSAKDRGGGVLGASLGGALAGFLTAGCTGPILAGILTYISANATPIQGAGIMAAYSLGLALPFFILGAVLSRLPKAGSWIVWTEALVGFGLVAVGSWMVAGSMESMGLHVPGWFLWASALAVVAMGATWAFLSARHRLSGKPLTAAIIVGLAASAATLAWLAASPPLSNAGWRRVTTDREYEAAVLATQGKIRVVKFFADWCADCKKVDRLVFSRGSVKKFLADPDLALIRVDATKGADELEHTARSMGVGGVPALRVLAPDGHEIKTARLDGPYGVPELRQVLEKARKSQSHRDHAPPVGLIPSTIR